MPEEVNTNLLDFENTQIKAESKPDHSDPSALIRTSSNPYDSFGNEQANVQQFNNEEEEPADKEE